MSAEKRTRRHKHHGKVTTRASGRAIDLRKMRYDKRKGASRDTGYERYA